MTDQFNEGIPSKPTETLDNSGFEKATGGLSKDSLHQVITDMRRFSSVSFSVYRDDGEEVSVTLTPGNMENGQLLPELAVKTADAVTTFKSFGGEKCTFEVIKLQLDGKEPETDKGAIITKDGQNEQDMTEFGKVPRTHWRALIYAKNAIEIQEKQKTTKKKKIPKILGLLFGK